MKVGMTVLLLIFAAGIMAVEDIVMEVRKIPEANLLKNPRFQTEKNNPVPANWSFSDYSKSPGFEYQTINGIFQIRTAGGLYGYLMQSNIPVEEGEKYFAEAWVKLNSRALLWCITMQYDDKLGAFQDPKSSTRIYSIANPAHGEKLVAELQYFINPDYLLPVSSTKWNRCALEFTVPEGRKITGYDFRIGAYGGDAGWIEIKDPYFSRSRQKLLIHLRGSNIEKLRICRPDGSPVEEFLLERSRESYDFEVRLNSRYIHYHAEIMTTDGKIIRRSL